MKFASDAMRNWEEANDIKVNILASGSSGNCIAISSKKDTILIDAGVAKTKIEKRLLEVGIRPDEIRAIFITHAHSDHIKGLPLANKYRLPVYATYGEWKGISGVDDNLQQTVATLYSVYEKIELSEVFVQPFKTHHDAIEPVGYAVYDGENKTSICLDTGKIDSEMLDAMRDSDVYIIEANHDIGMVEAGDYPHSVQARILSDIGHLSNDQTAAALKHLVQGRRERIYLTHLSSRNNMPKLAEMTVKHVLRQIGFIAGEHYEIEVV